MLWLIPLALAAAGALRGATKPNHDKDSWWKEGLMGGGLGLGGMLGASALGLGAGANAAGAGAAAEGAGTALGSAGAAGAGGGALGTTLGAGTAEGVAGTLAGATDMTGAAGTLAGTSSALNTTALGSAGLAGTAAPASGAAIQAASAAPTATGWGAWSAAHPFAAKAAESGAISMGTTGATKLAQPKVETTEVDNSAKIQPMQLMSMEDMMKLTPQQRSQLQMMGQYGGMA